MKHRCYPRFPEFFTCSKCGEKYPLAELRKFYLVCDQCARKDDTPSVFLMLLYLLVAAAVIIVMVPVAVLGAMAKKLAERTMLWVERRIHLHSLN